MKTKVSLLVMALSMLMISAALESKPSTQETPTESLQVVTFAGGCFWCVESDFEKHAGIVKVISGFSGGSVPNPKYKQVSKGGTGHVEAVQVYYDPKIINYTDLLQIFWRQINPTDNEGQFVDRGKHYRPVIFYHNTDQQQKAEESKQAIQASGRYDTAVNTEIIAFKNFYAAEDYHQDYYKKNPIRYKYYRYNSGRDQYLTKMWGDDLKFTARSQQKYLKPADDVIRKNLTSLQYQVTQNDETERAFKNTFWDNKKAGIYVDIVSGEPLFSSLDKYKSGTGWPSFTRPINTEYIVKKTDYLLLYPRTEVRSKFGNSHLGHLFTDGPEPTGLRYCINSASLRFIAVEKLQSAGYGDYVDLFSPSHIEQ